MAKLSAITHQDTPPTNTDLSRVLSSSASDSAETMRPIPAIGLSLDNLGARDLAENNQPPSSIGATSAATSIIIIRGIKACIACSTAVPA